MAYPTSPLEQADRVSVEGFDKINAHMADLSQHSGGGSGSSYGLVLPSAPDIGSALQAALDSCGVGETLTLNPPTDGEYPSYSLYGSSIVRIPSDVTLCVNAEIRISQDALIALPNPRGHLEGSGTINAINSTGAVNWSVRIGASHCTIRGLRFTGQGRTAAAFILYGATGDVVGTIDGGAITDCFFDQTQYGIFKQSDNTTLNDFLVAGNRFKDVVNCDAMIFNLGKGQGLHISDNVIEGVTSTLANAGFGISIAGPGGYATTEANSLRSLSITGNVVRGAIEGIHVENCWGYLITDNLVENIVANASFPTQYPGNAIIGFGVRNGHIADNIVRTAQNFGIWLETGWGGAAGEPTSAPDDTTIKDNTLRNCTGGAISVTQYDGTAGVECIVENNAAFNCGQAPYAFSDVRILKAINNYPESFAASQAWASSGTLNLGSVAHHTFPVTTAAAVTGVILPAGSYEGQVIRIINRSAFTITFAAAATSRVAAGTGAVIGASEAAMFMWDANYAGVGTGRWVSIGA